MTTARNAPVPRQDARCAPSGNDATDAPIAPTAPHAARVRELAALLAAGYIRALLSGGIPLALSPESEPLCGANAVNAPRVRGHVRDGEQHT